MLAILRLWFFRCSSDYFLGHSGTCWTRTRTLFSPETISQGSPSEVVTLWHGIRTSLLAEEASSTWSFHLTSPGANKMLGLHWEGKENNLVHNHFSMNTSPKWIDTENLQQCVLTSRTLRWVAGLQPPKFPANMLAGEFWKLDSTHFKVAETEKYISLQH